MAQDDAQSFFEQLDKDYAKAHATPPVDSGAQAAATPVSTEPQPDGGIMTGLGEAFADTARAVGGGIERAGRGILTTGIQAANVVKDGLAGPLRESIPDIPNPWEEGGIAPPLIDEPKHFINKMTKNITEAAIGQLVGNRLTNGGIQGWDILKSQAIGSALVVDPHMENMGNLIESVPSLQSPFTEWLASKPDDSFAMGKFKNTLSDTFGAALGSVLFKTVALGYKGGKGQIERMFGKSADDVAAELDAEVKALNTQGDSLSPESSTTGVEPLKPTFEPSKEWLSKKVSDFDAKVIHFTEKLDGKVADVRTDQTDTLVKYTVVNRGSGPEVEAWVAVNNPKGEGYGYAKVGSLQFMKQGDKLVPSDIAVSSRFQREGIGMEMVSLAKKADQSIDLTQTYKGDVSEAGANLLNKFNKQNARSKPAEKHLTLDPNAKGPNDLFDKSPSFNKKAGQDGSDLQQIKIDELDWRSADHIGDVDPKKVASLRAQLRNDPSKVPTISVEEMQDGKRFIMDGRHRLQAAKEEGYTHVTGKVYETKETAQLRIEAQAKKLTDLEAKAGGADKLAKVAERLKSADNAFNMTPEQYVDFQSRVAEVLKDKPGDLDNIFTKAGLDGNAFNLEKFNSPVAVKETVQAMAEVLAPQLEKNVHHKQSFEQIRFLADMLKVKPEVMLGNLETWGFNAKQMAPTLVAAKNMIQSLSESIARDAESIAISGVGGHQAKIAMMQKVQALAHIEGMAKSIQTAAARTTAAGRIVTKGNVTGEQMMKMLDEFGGADKVDQLATKLAALKGDPTKTMNMLRGNMFHKLVDAHNELWINSLLSGISTHVVNVGTAASQLFMKPFNITLGGAIRGDWDTAKQGLATWRAMGSMVKDSFRMAKVAFDIERPLISVTDKQLEIVPTISAQNFDLDPAKWLGWGVDHLGHLARIPSRFLGAEDEFFKQMNYRASLHAGATRQAMDLVKAGKLDWAKQVDEVVNGKLVKISEVDSFIAKKFDEGFQVEELADLGKIQTRGLNKEAVQYANESTFTQSLKVPTWKGNRSIAESIYQFANEHPMARGTILPFVKVPANLLREGFSYTPVVGQLRKQFWSDIAEGGTRGAEAIGKLATGSLLATVGTVMAVEGMITGAAPSDKEIRDRMFEKGWQPYSFKIGDTYIPFSRIDPYGIVFGLIGDFAQITHHLNEQERHSFGASFSLAMANLINSKGYLKGLVDFVDILGGGQGDGAVHKLNKIAESWTSSHIPNILRLAQDSSMKEIRGVMDSWLARTPGYGTLYGQGLPAKRGYFGDKVWQPVGWPWSALSPVKPSSETDDPALLELARLADGPSAAQFSMPPKRVGTLDLTEFKNKQGVTAYDRMIELLNETDFHKEVTSLVTSEDYLKNGTDGDAYYPGSREIDIKKLQKEYHAEAKEKMLDEFPELRELVEQDEDNAKASKAGDGSDPITRLLDLNK